MVKELEPAMDREMYLAYLQTEALASLSQNGLLVRSGSRAGQKHAIKDRDLDARVIARNLG